MANLPLLPQPQYSLRVCHTLKPSFASCSGNLPGSAAALKASVARSPADRWCPCCPGLGAGFLVTITSGRSSRTKRTSLSSVSSLFHLRSFLRRFRYTPNQVGPESSRSGCQEPADSRAIPPPADGPVPPPLCAHHVPAPLTTLAIDVRHHRGPSHGVIRQRGGDAGLVVRMREHVQNIGLQQSSSLLWQVHRLRISKRRAENDNSPAKSCEDVREHGIISPWELPLSNAFSIPAAANLNLSAN